MTEGTTEFQLVRSGMNLAMVQKYVRLLPPFHVSSGATRHRADVHLGHPLDITWDFSGRKIYSITSTFLLHEKVPYLKLIPSGALHLLSFQCFLRPAIVLHRI